MRCWKYGDGLGLCMIDCADGSGCATGECDPTWKTCIPRIETCGVPDTDTGTGGVEDSDYDGGADGGAASENKGGCACDAAGAGSSPGLLALILG
jgi:hypothetical protein